MKLRRWGRAGLVLLVLLLHVGLIDQAVHHVGPLDLSPGPLPVLQVDLLPPAPAAHPPEPPPARAVVRPRPPTQTPRPPPRSKPPAEPSVAPAQSPRAPADQAATPQSGPAAADSAPLPGVDRASPASHAGGPTGEQPATGPSATSAAAGPASPPAPLYGRPLLEPARSGRLVYAVYYGDFPQGQSLAHAVLSWQEQAGSYQLSSEARADGLTSVIYPGALAQTSRGRIGPDGLEPATYTEVRGRRPERSIDITARLASVSDPARKGLQDRLSILLQLSLLARTRPDQMAPGQVLSLPEINFSDIETVNYVSQGYVTLMTPAGPLHAIHLLRQRPDNPQEPRIEVWLGYDQGMLPIRLRVTDEYGRVIDQILKELP